MTHVFRRAWPAPLNFLLFIQLRLLFCHSIYVSGTIEEVDSLSSRTDTVVTALDGEC